MTLLALAMTMSAVSIEQVFRQWDVMTMRVVAMRKVTVLFNLSHTSSAHELQRTQGRLHVAIRFQASFAAAMVAWRTLSIHASKQ
jgi:hypothetical protein